MPEDRAMVAAIFRRLKTLADDTLQVVLEIEPLHRDSALQFLQRNGDSVVIAKLTNEAAREDMIKNNGRTLSQEAALLCKQETFMEYSGAANEEEAAGFMRAACGVDSRSKIVEGTPAGERFKTMRDDFRRWVNSKP